MILYVNRDLISEPLKDAWFGKYADGFEHKVVIDLDYNIPKVLANQKLKCNIIYVSDSICGYIGITRSKKIKIHDIRGLFFIDAASISNKGYAVLVDPKDKKGIKRVELFHDYSRNSKGYSKFGLYKPGACIVTNPNSKKHPPQYWKLTKKGWVSLGNKLPQEYKDFILCY